MATINFDGINDFGGMNFWKVRLLALLGFLGLIIFLVLLWTKVIDFNTPPTPTPSKINAITSLSGTSSTLEVIHSVAIILISN